MKKKSDLFKELGWDDQLIHHYMINDSEFDEKDDQQLIAEILDSRSMTVTFNAENSGSNLLFEIKDNT